nr:reverse transcriptase domain-containing protein [Tanacetum cinerariifolium]
PNQGNYLPEVRKELKICEAKYDKSSIDEPPEVKLKDLPPHLEYAFLEGDDKLPVIIAKDLSVKEKIALITILKSYKRAIAWQLSVIKGIDPEFYTHKILMEEDFEPAVQHQRIVNPKIHEVIKQEVLKIPDVGLIYPIFDSPWVGVPASFVKVGTFHFPDDFVVIDYDADPRVPLILKRSLLKIERALIDVFQGELTLRVGKEAITFNLNQTSRYSANYNDMTANRIDVIDMAYEEYSQEVLGFSNMIVSGNPTSTMIRLFLPLL